MKKGPFFASRLMLIMNLSTMSESQERQKKGGSTSPENGKTLVNFDDLGSFESDFESGSSSMGGCRSSGEWKILIFQLD